MILDVPAFWHCVTALYRSISAILISVIASDHVTTSAPEPDAAVAGAEAPADTFDTDPPDVTDAIIAELSQATKEQFSILRPVDEPKDQLSAEDD